VVTIDVVVEVDNADVVDETDVVVLETTEVVLEVVG
jgi:hypothetical protein